MSNAGLCFPLQVDYESEEDDDKADEGEDKEDQGEAEDENEKNEEDGLEDSQSQSRGEEKSKKKKKKSQKTGEEQDRGENQMRVNCVLQSNPAIQRYSYDTENELWCEVGFSCYQKKSTITSVTHLCRSLMTLRGKDSVLHFSYLIALKSSRPAMKESVSMFT